MPAMIDLFPGVTKLLRQANVAVRLMAGGSPPPGNVFYVNSNGATVPGRTPYLTLAAALAQCTANQGDTIYVLPGHAETISGAAGIAVNVAGVRIIGLGQGAKRPTFTFGTSTAATMTITANDVHIENIVGVCAIDSLVSAFVISGANVTFGTPDAPVEWQDGSSAIEALRAVLTTAAADKLSVHLVYRGYAAGDAGVNAVRLVGCDGARLSVDYYGICTTSVVEFLTTACTNVEVTGRFYVSGTTDYSKNVVDTQGSSKWTVRGFDAAADSYFLGGDAVAVHADPSITAVTDALYGTNGIASFPSAADPGNGVSLAEVLRSVWDAQQGANGIATYPAAAAPGNGVSMAEVLRSVWDATQGANGIGTYPASAVYANNVSLAEVLAYVQDLAAGAQLNRNSARYLAVTADMTSATWNTAAAHEILTVTGAVHLRILPQVTSTLTSSGGGATLVLGDETTTNSLIASTDAENLATGEWWFDATDTRTLAAKSIYDKLDVVVGNGKDIGYTIGTEALTGGTIIFHVWWEPIDATGAVVAGAGGTL